MLVMNNELSKGILMKKTILTLSTIILLVLAFGAYSFSHIVRSAFIDFLDFNKIDGNIYLSETLPEQANQKITQLIENARTRITEYYGKPEAQPIIIVIGTEQEAKNYRLYDTPGTLYFTPWQNYLVLSYKNMNIDVISHELVHAEIVHRLGYFTRQQEIPTWFDEGAALQVDLRPNYTKITQISQDEFQRVITLDSPDKFWSSDKAQNIKNYQSSKVVVTQFFQEHPSLSLYAMLQMINDGKTFKQIINEEKS